MRDKIWKMVEKERADTHRKADEAEAEEETPEPESNLNELSLKKIFTGHPEVYYNNELVPLTENRTET